MFLVILVLAVSFFSCLSVCLFFLFCLFVWEGGLGGSNTFFAASRPSNQLIVDVTVH